jgi:hypothetical protein
VDWLTSEEKHWIARELAREAAEVGPLPRIT